MAGRYEIINKYSEALKTYYSALHRSREESLDLFRDIDFEVLRDEDMFEEGSPLNKWAETRLRLYLLRHRGNER